MSVWKQIAFGSFTLIFCMTVHVSVLGIGIDLLREWGGSGIVAAAAQRWIFLILIASMIVLTGHTLQVWAWALSFRGLGALSQLDEAIYFALVTTTTLGYGDVTLDRRFRIYGAMAAVSGLMTYGLSTAFLVGLTFQVLETSP